MFSSKETVKNLLGEVPFTAELYWLLRQRGEPIKSRFSLKQLNANLPEMVAEANRLRQSVKPGKNVFIFASLHFWIEHATVLGLSLAALGHNVTLGFLPYADWQKQINLFDLRRQNAYAKKVLSKAQPLIEVISFLDRNARYKVLPHDVEEAVNEVTVNDTQYTLQIEDIDTENEIYQLRLERNQEMARRALAWFETNHPDVVIVPNGTIQELGVVYRIARHFKVPTVTYEFSDQRQRMWLALNNEVMQQNTDKLWEAKKNKPLSKDQLDRLRSLFEARKRGIRWENFARQWQGVPSQGGIETRASLGLDNRPIVLLATNVLGDSLTLGRQLFSRNMAEWISRTVQYFSGRPEIQLIIRVHPGEVLTHGVSMSNVVSQVLPDLPEHIRLIGPKNDINTYDLAEIADVGLVYTTTVGLEMAMNGQPVVVTGKTHYRGRGFTYDPDSWVNYYKTLGRILENPKEHLLSQEKIDLAWQYAYYFFFEYPRPFPWHLVNLWDDYRQLSLSEAFSSKNRLFEDTFRYLIGEPIDWNSIDA